MREPARIISTDAEAEAQSASLAPSPMTRRSREIEASSDAVASDRARSGQCPMGRAPKAARSLRAREPIVCICQLKPLALGVSPCAPGAHHSLYGAPTAGLTRRGPRSQQPSSDLSRELCGYFRPKIACGTVRDALSAAQHTASFWAGAIPCRESKTAAASDAFTELDSVVAPTIFVATVNLCSG
jgi:hypothetical protein